MSDQAELLGQLGAQFRNWLDRLSDDQIAALTGHWENIMDDAALFRADSWVITEKAIARLREGQPETGEAVRHYQDHETREHRTGDTSMKNHNPRRDPNEAEAGPVRRSQRQRLQMRASAKANRLDDQRPTEEIPPGPLQNEGVWQPRTRRP